MNNWFNRYAYAGCLPDDSPQMRLQKAIMVIAPSLLSFFCIFWVTGYFLLGKPLSASIPGGYAVFSIASVLVFFRTKHYSFFRFSQLFLILCLPFLLQASLGGFRAGSAVQMWAMLAPVGALMFQGTRPASRWFGAFVVLTILNGFAEGYLSTTIEALPQWAITLFFVLNFCCAFFLIYICVHYFVVENKRILSIIREQTNKLMELDQIKNRFFANLSHEFRTPLALTIGPLEDALRGEFGELGGRLSRQLEVMLRNSRRLLRLINQLLDISKIESGEMKLDKRRCDLRKLAADIFRAFTPYAERKQIDFQAELGDVPLNLDVDPNKLEQVINNLLSNAIKFTPEGKGRVRLMLQQTHETAPGIRLCVRDNGPGIALQDTNRIFDRFFQVDGSSSREHEGTGIGLSLVKELVELHGGSIEVKSELGFGSEFSVFIPGKVDSAPWEHPARAAGGKGDKTVLIELASLDDGGGNCTNMGTDGHVSDRATVLVVDDNADIRDYLTTCLSPIYNVLQASDGAIGLELAQRYQPDLVISDIMMPGVDGYQLCRAIREDEKLNRTPVIFLTAKASEDMKLEGLNVGADDYLAKPFSTRELLARSRNLIKLRRQERELGLLNTRLEQQVKNQIEELVKNRRLTSYFSGSLLQRILSEDEAVDLVTERRNITILFCDLCNFTDMTDRMEAEKATVLLNEYLSAAAELVEQHGATVVQIIGDAIMAFFGAPKEMESSAQATKAVGLGIALQRKIGALSNEWLARGLEYAGELRIGIHQDYVTVGNFGSQNLMEYTAVGRGVNLAARLEASCSPGRIKVSHPVYLLTRDVFDYEAIREEEFKGFARALCVCELDPNKQAVRATG